jgi:hypothetical protein
MLKAYSLSAQMVLSEATDYEKLHPVMLHRKGQGNKSNIKFSKLYAKGGFLGQVN